MLDIYANTGLQQVGKVATISWIATSFSKGPLHYTKEKGHNQESKCRLVEETSDKPKVYHLSSSIQLLDNDEMSNHHRITAHSAVLCGGLCVIKGETFRVGLHY